MSWWILDYLEYGQLPGSNKMICPQNSQYSWGEQQFHLTFCYKHIPVLYFNIMFDL